MRWMVIGLFLFAALSGCAKEQHFNISNIGKKMQNSTILAGNLIEKGTSNWYNKKFSPPLTIDKSYSIGRLSKQNVTVYRNNLYIGDEGGWLYKIAAQNGKIIKLLKVDHGIGFSGCISEGVLYFSDIDRNIYSYNIDKGSLTKHQTGAPVYSAPTCSKGKAYFLDSNQTLYAVDKSTILWNNHFLNARIEMKGEASPVINGRNLIAATDDGFLYKIRNGNVVQSVEANPAVEDPNTAKDIDSRPAVDILGNIYITTVNGIVASFDKTFHLLWKKVGVPAAADLILSPNELIVSDLDGGISSYDTDTGNLLWKINISKKPLIGSAVMLDKTIYQPTLNGYLYAISENGRILWREMIDGSGFASKPVFYDGFLYLSARSGRIYRMKSTK